MSLPTVTCFILFFGCAMLARPYDGWTAILFAPNSGGSAARRLFPAMMIMPFFVNGMVVLAYRFRPFEAPFGFAVLSVATTVGLGIIIITIANGLGRHEEERLRSEGMLEAIVENSLSIIFVKDLAGRYLMVNRRFLEAFRIEREAVIGKTDYDIFSQYEAASFRAMDQRVAQAGQPLMGEELVSQADGFHTYISIKAPLKDAAGRLYAVFGISTDITDKKRSEKAAAAPRSESLKDAGA
jgi:PAS domain S-box-containing protein